MKSIFPFLLFFGFFHPSFAQDTLFTAKHTFSTPVRNVFSANGKVYAKTGDKLFELNENQWKEQEITFQKPYVFFDEHFYESDFIPKSELFDVSKMTDLIPQRGVFIATGARLGERLFVTIGSSLFEYEIRDHYTKSLHNTSIRDIYIEDSLKVISTYSGIFVNDSIQLKYPTFSNGPLVKFGNRYFLSWDELSEFFPPDSTVLIPAGTSPFAGKSRKLLQWKGEMYAMNTLSVSKVHDGFELHPIHQGEEYLDMEAYGEEGILISTLSGNCFYWDGKSIRSIANVPSRIRDIYVVGNRIYLASDLGVYVLENLNQESPKLLFDIPYVVAQIVDGLGNFWISSENGLYVVYDQLPDEPLEVISLVEFNREAIWLYKDNLYVGAVDGLYTLDISNIEMKFIPKAISEIEVKQTEPLLRWGIISGTLVLIFGVLGYRFFRKDPKSSSGEKDSFEKGLNLEQLEQEIIEQKILSVEALAAHLDTNTVQLNRNFKKLDTTPGKFLKQVKLKQARILIQSGLPLEEIALSIGYSTKFLKNELELE